MRIAKADKLLEQRDVLSARIRVVIDKELPVGLSVRVQWGRDDADRNYEEIQLPNMEASAR